MPRLLSITFVAAALLTLARPVSADVRLTMHDGLVSIVARDATLRQILEEWARVGQTTFVNAERIAGTPVTIELSDVPEKQALDILLRSISGYLAAPRPTMIPNASRFDRIIVNPAAAQPRSAASMASAPPPPLPQTRFQLQPIQPESNDSPNPNIPGEPGQRQPLVNVYTPPIPSPEGGRGVPAPASAPAAPVVPIGTSAPGMVMPASPQQPGTMMQPQPQSGAVQGRF